MTFKDFMTGPWWPHSWLFHGFLKFVGLFDGKDHGLDFMDRMFGTGKYKDQKGTAARDDGSQKDKNKKKDPTQVRQKMRMDRMNQAKQSIEKLYKGEDYPYSYSILTGLLDCSPDSKYEMTDELSARDKMADYILALVADQDKDALDRMMNNLNYREFTNDENLYTHIIHADRSFSVFHEGYEAYMRQKKVDVPSSQPSKEKPEHTLEEKCENARAILNDFGDVIDKTYKSEYLNLRIAFGVDSDRLNSKQKEKMADCIEAMYADRLAGPGAFNTMLKKMRENQIDDPDKVPEMIDHADKPGNPIYESYAAIKAKNISVPHF